ncbi:MAG TPA: efflux RND transporter periplasmic adaptor subunit [Pirellulaceae bacterium]|jgi:HlyD family secretion protein
MRTLIIAIVVVLALVGGVAAGYKPAMDYWQKQNAPKWRTAEVAEGEIVSVVTATGTIKPVSQISVGSFVSGPIDPNYQLVDEDGNVRIGRDGKPMQIADFNQEVKKGEMLAKVDQTIYKANFDRDQATVETKKADLARVEALLYQARNDEKRSYALRAEDPAFIAQAELDRVRFNRMQLEAQVKLAQAAIVQADAQLVFSLAQLRYTDIKSPVDGIIINRKIDPGQTLAAQFQAPELFVVAPDMRSKMLVHASVDEADIGLIHEAQRKSLPVTFTVDAYPDDLFEGQIEEIRLSSTTTQNVVTYPVIVAAPNPDLKLLPGMTASISFEVNRRADILKIPNSALRYFPQAQYVRESDKELLEGRSDPKKDDKEITDAVVSAAERATARRKRNQRHVWVQDGYKLKAIAVQTGLSDSQFTEMMNGDLVKGDKLVIGVQPPGSSWGQ